MENIKPPFFVNLVSYDVKKHSHSLIVYYSEKSLLGIILIPPRSHTVLFHLEISKHFSKEGKYN